MKAVGIDVGSLTTKVVVLDGDGVLITNISPSGDEPASSARTALEATLGQQDLNVDRDCCLVSTGIGGKLLPFAHQQKATTTCLARGVHHLFPSARTAVDIGAESCTVLRISERGRVKDWVNHDKCAAGTGVFLQKMARIMRLSLAEMSGPELLAASGPDITSTCAVFAESEVISHVHRDPPTPRAEIITGIYSSVVSRIVTLCKRVGIEEDVAAVGGVARNTGLIALLERALECRILVSEAPQLAAALGAALVAREKIETGGAS